MHPDGPRGRGGRAGGGGRRPDAAVIKIIINLGVGAQQIRDNNNESPVNRNGK